MIIPIRCFSCGKLLADKWTYYQKRLQEEKGDAFGTRTYFDGTTVPNTVEARILKKELQLVRYCCVVRMLTHVSNDQAQ